MNPKPDVQDLRWNYTPRCRLSSDVTNNLCIPIFACTHTGYINRWGTNRAIPTDHAPTALYQQMRHQPRYTNWSCANRAIPTDYAPTVLCQLIMRRPRHTNWTNNFWDALMCVINYRVWMSNYLISWIRHPSPTSLEHSKPIPKKICEWSVTKHTFQMSRHRTMPLIMLTGNVIGPCISYITKTVECQPAKYIYLFYEEKYYWFSGRILFLWSYYWHALVT